MERDSIYVNSLRAGNLLAASLAFAALVGLTSSVDASCGDYVTIGNPRQDHVSMVTPATVKEILRDIDVLDIARRSDDAPVAPRCQGPHCRWSVPPVSPATPTHDEISSPSERAIDADADEMGGNSSNRRFADHRLSDWQTHRRRLDRPPQGAL